MTLSNIVATRDKPRSTYRLSKRRRANYPLSIRSFFENSQVHIHIPEGATPKDGPSAGITMVTAIISLLRDTPIVDDLCMTGELTLTGRVLPIGGVKEKLVAAKRGGLKSVIFPKDNLRDVDELADYIKDGITIHFVEHYDEVFKIAFPDSKFPSI